MITGNTGFKGAWLSLWLTKLGATVFGYSLNTPSKPNMFDALDLMHHKEITTEICGDIRNRNNLSLMFNMFKPEIVFHLAAQTIVSRSFKMPINTFETNVIGTANVLQTIKEMPSVKAAVIVTSDKCYKNKELKKGYCEYDELGGDDPYSASKACAELVVKAYRKSFKLQAVTVRAGNCIGGGDWEYRVLPEFIRHLVENKSFRVYAPKSVRPWQFVLEPLYGYLLVGAKMLENGKAFTKEFNGSWNFGPPEKDVHTTEELIKKVIEHWKSGTYVCIPEDTLETGTLLLNSDKARRLLGWKIIYDFNTAVKKTVDWYKAYYNKENMYNFSLEQITEYISDVKQ